MLKVKKCTRFSRSKGNLTKGGKIKKAKRKILFTKKKRNESIIITIYLFLACILLLNKAGANPTLKI